MSTILSFLSGRQITNNSGVPQAGAKLFHYRETTTTNLTVWTNDIATVAHAQPVVCDAGGFVPLIYVDDTFDWKVLITTSAGVVLQTYDNIPKAVSTTSTGFFPPLWSWTQVTSASSPITLAVADAGKAYEADTTSGSITFNLPAVASVGNGKGFAFKKTAGANSLILDPNGSETIDGISTPLTITDTQAVIEIFSNGAQWYVVTRYPGLPTGSVVAHAHPSGTVPDGWLECNGAAVSRTTFAGLFAILGAAYGPGDGSTTFNIPDLRGEFIRGWDHGKGSDPDSASRTSRGDGTTGNNVGTKQSDQFRSHTHDYNDDPPNGNHPTGTGSTESRGTQTQTHTTAAAGGNETRPRNVNLMYIIKY